MNTVQSLFASTAAPPTSVASARLPILLRGSPKLWKMTEAEKQLFIDKAWQELLSTRQEVRQRIQQQIRNVPMSSILPERFSQH